MKKINLIISLVAIVSFMGIIISLMHTDFRAIFFAFLSFWACLFFFLYERNIEKIISTLKEDNEKQYKVNSSILEFTEDTIEHYKELYSSIDMLYMELKKVSPDNKVADEIIENLNIYKNEKDKTVS